MRLRIRACEHPASRRHAHLPQPTASPERNAGLFVSSKAQVSQFWLIIRKTAGPGAQKTVLRGGMAGAITFTRANGGSGCFALLVALGMIALLARADLARPDRRRGAPGRVAAMLRFGAIGR